MKLTLIHLALKEWRRRPIRTLLSASGVALAMAALTCLVAFLRGYQRGMQAELERLGAHVLVVPKGCPYDAASIALHGANWPCYLKGDYLGEVRSVRLVATAAPALMCAFPKTDGSSEVFVGVTPEILRLRPNWIIDGRFPQGTNEILVGADAARRKGWRTGDTVQPNRLPARPHRVAGVLAATGSAEDGFIFLRLEDAQSAFRHDRELTHILVKLRDTDDLDDAVTQLRGCNAGMDMNIVPLSHLFRTIQQLLQSTRVWLGCVTLVALLAAAFGVGNSLLMSVSERTREIGILRAIGASRVHVFLLFWMETVQVCLAGGTAGLMGAFAFSRTIETWLRSQLPFAPTDSLLRAEPALLAAGLVGAVALGSLAGFLPAWRAARLEPILAIRKPAGGW